MCQNYESWLYIAYSRQSYCNSNQVYFLAHPVYLAIALRLSDVEIKLQFTDEYIPVLHVSDQYLGVPVQGANDKRR